MSDGLICQIGSLSEYGFIYATITWFEPLVMREAFPLVLLPYLPHFRPILGHHRTETLRSPPPLFPGVVRPSSSLAPSLGTIPPSFFFSMFILSDGAMILRVHPS